MKEIRNNKVKMSGHILTDFEWNHEMYGENFYTAHLGVKRTSGSIDSIVIMVSERLVDVKMDWKNEAVEIKGTLRSYNKQEENGIKLILTVFVERIEAIEGIYGCDENDVYLEGTICKEPLYRKTPLGREITDVIIAVNRPFGKSDYIPCLCWGRNALYTSSLTIGTKVAVQGRFQSREYTKRIGEELIQKTAYELSIQKIEEV